MKMRITVEGKKYDVEVEMLDAALPTAAAPAAPILKPKPEVKPEAKPETKPGAVIETKAEAKAEHKPDPKVDAKGWHQVSEGKPGEVCAPVSGTVGEVRVKIGDTIKVGDSLVHRRAGVCGVDPLAPRRHGEGHPRQEGREREARAGLGQGRVSRARRSIPDSRSLDAARRRDAAPTPA